MIILIWKLNVTEMLDVAVFVAEAILMSTHNIHMFLWRNNKNYP